MSKTPQFNFFKFYWCAYAFSYNLWGIQIWMQRSFQKKKNELKKYRRFIKKNLNILSVYHRPLNKQASIQQNKRHTLSSLFPQYRTPIVQKLEYVLKIMWRWLSQTTKSSLYGDSWLSVRHWLSTSHRRIIKNKPTNDLHWIKSTTNNFCFQPWRTYQQSK